jgi:hypothetical protein
VLDIVVHRNIRLSNVIVSDILHSDHLPTVFHILDPLVREGALIRQDRNFQKVNKHLVMNPDGARHQNILTDRPSVAK